MSARRLTIISTRLPPAEACGIGSYSQRLQQNWPNEQSNAEFLVMEGAGERVTAFHGDAAAFARELARVGSTDILLHYAGRAYQRFGRPVWMPKAIARWKKQFPQNRLAIFFHELPGSFPITSRQFWLAKASTRIIRQLMPSADVLLTNTPEHARQLTAIGGRSDIHLFPVGSNIETGEVSNEPRRRNEFVVFGLPFGRWQTLHIFAAQIRRWHADGSLAKVHLIGPQDAEFSKRADALIAEELLVRHGLLASGQVAALLRRAGFALTNVSEKTWSKSGSFMACAANECPIVIASAKSDLPPLSYAVSAGEVGTISEAELRARSSALAEWYRTNADWPVIAAGVAKLL